MQTTPTEPRYKLLIIDDDRKLCRLIAGYLEPFGYQVTPAHTGPDGLEQARAVAFDAIILDVMLPGMDGFEVLQALRQSVNTPVLMLTSRGDETDRIVGLEMGADDYLPKTFSTRELLARLRAVTRRNQRNATEDADSAAQEGATRELHRGQLVINEDARAVRIADDPLSLTPIEYDLLLCLAKAAGRVKSRDQLLDAVTGRDYEVFDRSIDVHISSLRRKLGDNPKAPRYIKTVRAVGYMFLEVS